ncbi:MAG: hypothetical protein AAFN76_12590 [Pseudomonadota bacterium]
MSNIIRDVEDAGMRLEIGGDFAAYKRLRNSQADRSDPYPMFNVSSSYVDDTNAFWVCGFNHNNDLVHTQAIRLLEMRGTSLGEHLEQHRHKYITPGSTPDPDHTFFARPSALSNITGKVCYHGEFWLQGGDGGHRSQGFTALLSRIVFEIALRIWSPDFVFGLVPMKLAFKGIPARYGYMHSEPGVWLGPDREITSEEMLVWMSQSDISSFLDTSPQALSNEGTLPSRLQAARNMSIVA